MGVGGGGSMSVDEGPVRRILIILDDQEEMMNGLAVDSRSEAYEVQIATQGAVGLSLALGECPDLIILDVLPPGTRGLDRCRDIRRTGVEAPIVMLGVGDVESERVLGLEIGADDYLTTPFSLRELLATVRARLRYRPQTTQSVSTRYRFGDVEIDFGKLRVERGGRALELSAKQLDLLRFLVRRRGETLTRDEILRQVWGYKDPPLTRTVDTHILKLRQKIEPEPANPIFIQTVYGTGYRFAG